MAAGPRPPRAPPRSPFPPPAGRLRGRVTRVAGQRREMCPVRGTGQRPSGRAPRDGTGRNGGLPPPPRAGPVRGTSARPRALGHGAGSRRGPAASWARARVAGSGRPARPRLGARGGVGPRACGTCREIIANQTGLSCNTDLLQNKQAGSSAPPAEGSGQQVLSHQELFLLSAWVALASMHGKRRRLGTALVFHLVRDEKSRNLRRELAVPSVRPRQEWGCFGASHLM